MSALSWLSQFLSGSGSKVRDINAVSQSFKQGTPAPIFKRQARKIILKSVTKGMRKFGL